MWSNSVLPASPENILISCTPTDDLVLPDYLEALEAAGFEETIMMTDSAGEVLSVTMENDPVVVQIMNSGMSDGLMIKVKQNQP